MAKRLLMVCLLLLSGCSYFQKDEDKAKEPDLPADAYYQQGLEALKQKRFQTAAKQFDELEKHHPASQQATRSQMYRVYAHYMAEEYEETIVAAERFIRYNPRHPHVSYAYYMRGLSYYQRISDAYRDQGFTREAMAAFQELISRYPTSDYADQAKSMLTLCHDRLAEQEMVVGRYYLDRGEYIAAMNRFKGVIQDRRFTRTPYQEEALFNMIYASLKLGMGEEARNYASVLGHNHPDSKFYNEAVALLAGKGEISDDKMKDLRKGVEEGSLFKRFFEGLRPGMPDLGDKSGL